MKLYWFSSTNPQKVRLALEELKLDYELIPVDLYKGLHRKGELAEKLPRKKLPVLEADGVTLHESGAILLWLGTNYGLWPTQPEAQADALSLLFMESAAFQEPASAFFWDKVVLPRVGATPRPERVEKARKKIRPQLDLLEERLESSEWLCGDFTVVDCAYAAWLTVVDLDEHPRLTDFMNRMRQRPAWLACEFEY